MACLGSDVAFKGRMRVIGTTMAALTLRPRTQPANMLGGDIEKETVSVH